MYTNIIKVENKKDELNHTKDSKIKAFGDLLDVLDTLRVKCPWDKKQTNESLRTNTIEEVYELNDAILHQDNKNICEELGDLLLHICFYSKIGDEKSEFDIQDVCEGLIHKMKYRHPHIYGNVKVDNEQDVLHNWELLKLKEKKERKTVLEGVPSELPSIIKSYRMQDKARNAGFTWKNREDVWNKVKEEIDEFQTEINRMDKDKMESEFGDVLFSLIGAARLYKINPDSALEKTNKKFKSRFDYLEAKILENGKELSNASMEEMDAYWNEAKRK